MGDEATVRDKAVLMVQTDPVHARQGRREHIAAYHWMQDYAAKVIAERRTNPQQRPDLALLAPPRSTATGSTSARCC